MDLDTCFYVFHVVFTYRANIIDTSFTHLHVIHVSHYMYTCTWYKHTCRYILRNWGYAVYTIYGISRLHNLGVGHYMIYMTSTYIISVCNLYLYNTDLILHTKHDATLCECIFITENAYSNLLLRLY